MASNCNQEEPSTAPKPNRWYNISLGSSLKDQHQPNSKFCTLRYEFKPASIDKNQPGLLHKSKDYRVKVEFENNQHGKPKVTFDGVCEDYKDNDAVLFFDGETFRLERLHRAVKRLRHVRQLGESMAAATCTTAMAPSVGPAAESYSPPLGKGPKPESSNKSPVPPLLEHIDTGDFNTGGEHASSIPVDTDEEVDLSEDEEHKAGRSAAEALRAQVNAEEKEEQSSSSSSSSGSESSGSGSGSESSGSGSGSGSESSDGNSEVSI